MRACLILVFAVGCACPSKPAAVGAGSGSGAKPVGPVAADCEPLRAHVEQLYGKDIQRGDLIADDVAMVMKDCAKEPARVVPCASKVATVAELEKTCLIPLDPEGTEGEGLKK